MPTSVLPGYCYKMIRFLGGRLCVGVYYCSFLLRFLKKLQSAIDSPDHYQIFKIVVHFVPVFNKSMQSTWIYIANLHKFYL